MSQIIKRLSSEPVPPEVAEEFGTDFASNGTRPGTATPSNNKLYLLGLNGISTITRTTDAPNDTVYFNLSPGATTTTGAETKTIISLGTDTDTGFIAQCLLTAFDNTNNLVFGGRMTITGKNKSGTASVINFLEKVKDGEDDGVGHNLKLCDFSASTSGAIINITVTGTVNSNLTWSIIFPGIGGGETP